MYRYNIHTIRPDASFIDEIAAHVLDIAGRSDPLAVADVRVILPYRRAAREFRNALLRLYRGTSLILPRVYTLGDIAEDGDFWTAEAVDISDIPPAIGKERRRLLMAELLQKGMLVDNPDHAMHLAISLAELMDEMQREQCEFSALEHLVPADFSEQWQKTIDFLKVIEEDWPKILQAEGAIDPVDRRNRILERQAEFWQNNPPAYPVIAAGTTGSQPSTARMLKVIAGLPRGQIILPGLDMSVAEDYWQAIEEHHPQYGMKKLLELLAVRRADVVPLGSGTAITPERSALVTEMSRPGKTLEQWQHLKLSAGAFEGLSICHMHDEQEEAELIAILLRQQLERPDAKAALVTLDRSLARRVAANLKRWGIDIDDSAGQGLTETRVSIFLRLALDAVVQDLAPVPLLSLLKHPLACAGKPPAGCRAMVRDIEKIALRNVRFSGGFSGLSAILEQKNRTDLARWIEAIYEAAKPLIAALQKPETLVDELLQAHVAFAEWLATSDKEQGALRLWSGDDGKAVYRAIANYILAAQGIAPINSYFYDEFFKAMLAGTSYWAAYGKHPRLFILSPMEARLQQHDMMIVGGLNQGVWPKEHVSPWMSHRMREELGITTSRRLAGISAHDFAGFLYAPKVVCTRARRIGGNPTVASPWLSRLEAIAEVTGHKAQLDPDPSWRQWMESLQHGKQVAPISPPRPSPPLAARPRKLSATQIERLMRDPYSIYCSHILRLKALPPIDSLPDVMEFGSAVHHILDMYIKCGEQGLDVLQRCVDEELAQFKHYPSVLALWRPRLMHIIQWFFEQDNARREAGKIQHIATETDGMVSWDAPGGVFTLVARADRIETYRDGSSTIVDYKTGGPIKNKEVDTGRASQLNLMGWMLSQGGFAEVSGSKIIGSLEYWYLSFSKESKISAIEPRTRETEQGIKSLISLFDNDSVAYLSHPVPEYAIKANDYMHLARVYEWSEISTSGRR